MSKNFIKKTIIKNMRHLVKTKMNLGYEGNISIRCKNGFLIPKSGLNPCDMKIDDIVFIDSNGYFSKSLKPSTEWQMHHYIYKERTEVSAVVHCHSMWASILSCLRINIPAFHYMVSEMGGIDIKCSKYATFGTSKLAKNIVLAIKERNGCLISNHGQVTIGYNIEQATHLAFALEKLAKQFYFCLLSNKNKLLSKKEITESLKLFGDYKSIH